MEFVIGLAAGILLGGMAGALVSLLLRPASKPAGEELRRQLQTAESEIEDLRRRLRLVSRQRALEERQLSLTREEAAGLRVRLEEVSRRVERLLEREADSQEVGRKLNRAYQEISELRARLDITCERFHEERRSATTMRRQLERWRQTMLQFVYKAGRWAAEAAEGKRLRQELQESRARNQPAESEPSPPDLQFDPLEKIRGIGPVYARRLRQARIYSFADLAGRSPEELGRITGAPPSAAGDWLTQARKMKAGV